MNELQLLQDFRAEISAPGADSVRAAREALTSRFGRREPWWRRRLVVAVAIGLLAVLGASTALGLGDWIVDRFRSNPPVSHFQAMMNVTHDGSFFPRSKVTGEWRGVTATQTAIGPVGIYAAPEETGGICWHAVFVDPEVTVLRGHVMGACGDKEPSRLFEGGVTQWTDVGRFPGAGRATGKTFQILIGRAGRGAASVDVHFCRRAPRRIQVRETFVLHSLPVGTRVPRLVFYDAGGRRLGAIVPRATMSIPKSCG